VLLPSPPLSEWRHYDARRHAVCVSAALVSAAKVMRCIQCSLVVVVVVVLSHCRGSSNTGWPQTWKTWYTQGFLWTWKTHGILREFCATSGKNCNKQSIFSLSFKYLCKTAVGWVNRIISISGSSDPGQSAVVTLMELMWNDLDEGHLLHLLFVAITYGKVSLWLWNSLENSRNFFSYFVATLW